MVKKIAVSAASLIVLAVLGYLLIMGAGKPISTDLSIIGQGKPVLVLAYENFSPDGGDALNRLRRFRNAARARLCQSSSTAQWSGSVSKAEWSTTTRHQHTGRRAGVA